MNEQDKKLELIKKHFPKFFIYSRGSSPVPNDTTGSTVLVDFEALVKTCREKGQMEKDIKIKCVKCRSDDFNQQWKSCPVISCEFHKYGFWKE